MKLMVHERLMLLNLIPNKGQYEALKVFSKTRQVLQFTPEEQELYKLEIDASGQAHWDTDAAAKNVLDVPLEEFMVRHFQKKLQEVEKKGELTPQMVSVYEKFIIQYRPEE